MSWDEMYRNSIPCFCEEGNIITIAYMDDWNRRRYDEFIDCPKCKENYEYSHESVGRPDKGHVRGWVLKSKLEEERLERLERKKEKEKKRRLEEEERKRVEEERIIILQKLKVAYYELWLDKFRGLNKVQINEILCKYDIFKCAYSTFCNITTKYKKEKVLDYVGTLFLYNLLGKILIFLKIEELEWSSIVQDEKYITEIKLQIANYKENIVREKAQRKIDRENLYS